MTASRHYPRHAGIRRKIFFLLKCICMINHSGCGYGRVRIDTQAQTITGDEEVGQLDR